MEAAFAVVGTVVGRSWATALKEILKEELKERLNYQQWRLWWRGLRDEDIEFLRMELRSIQAALRVVGAVPPAQLPEHLKDWAYGSREVSNDIQDILDTFLVRVEEGQQDKARHQVAMAIIDVKRVLYGIARSRTWQWHADSFAGHRRRVDTTTAAAANNPEPLAAAATAAAGHVLVGIEEPRDQLIHLLMGMDDEVSDHRLKVVSVLGLGGMGKTTLAKAVYQQLAPQFDCRAFVNLSRDPDMKKVITNMLQQLDGYRNISEAWWDGEQLLLELRQFLHNKRYLIVIDDIWDSESWQKIRHAVVDDNVGSRIIMTTRIADVAQQVSCIYLLGRLSDADSKALFYKIAFGSGGGYHDNQLDEKLLDTILWKFGGLPLAVRLIGSLLASKPRQEWYDVLMNIDSQDGLYTITGVLRQSYCQLPSHLRACLLYLSIFPEDYELRRDRLVWMWIAEGFIQGKQGVGLFQIGQKYFQELLNRSLIQEVDRNDVSDATAKYCCVHDLVHDIVCSLARDENFVTIWVGEQERQTTSRFNKVRRLSLQNTQLQRRRIEVDMAHVRTVSAFGTGIDLMPPLSSFKVLRVLDFEGCDLTGSYHYLEHLGELLHLRYLGLRGTNVAQLPREIGNLRFLQILDLKGTTIRVSPSTVALLHRLLCLYTEQETRMPIGLGNLTSLEEVSTISVRESSPLVKELGSLVELKVLDIVLQQDMSESSQKDFLQSLCKLHKIEALDISGCSDLDFIGEGWEPPRSLRRFATVDGSFSALPTWAENLTELQLGVREHPIAHQDEEQQVRSVDGSESEISNLASSTIQEERSA